MPYLEKIGHIQFILVDIPRAPLCFEFFNSCFAFCDWPSSNIYKSRLPQMHLRHEPISYQYERFNYVFHCYTIRRKYHPIMVTCSKEFRFLMNNLKASCSFDEFGFVIATFCTPGQQHDSWVCYYLFFYFKKPHNFLFGTSFRPFYRLWNMSDQPAIPLIPSIFTHLQFLKLIYIQFQSSSWSRYWNACSWRCEYIFQLLPRRIFLTIC